jgi:hypothetical protein
MVTDMEKEQTTKVELTHDELGVIRANIDMLMESIALQTVTAALSRNIETLKKIAEIAGLCASIMQKINTPHDLICPNKHIRH